MIARPRQSPSTQVQVVQFRNQDAEQIVGVVDSGGNGDPEIAVVIPPAWGKTKETLLPLARTIVESFEDAGIPSVVLRFDGVRKRGESFCDEEFRGDPSAQLGFTFSQGVVDIKAAVEFLAECYGSPRIALISFSASSVEARRFVAEYGSKIHGWVSVVGTADVQSMMRVISGGVDYIGGAERGAVFGKQEVLGVTVDVDRASRDVLQESLGFLDDSIRDFAKIECPVTWIHGRHDAWMDKERVAKVLSSGDISKRRFLEVPTGHQLRSSSEALEVFQLIAREIGRATLGRQIRTRPPGIRSLRKRTIAERSRLTTPEIDLTSFWERYLLGGSEGSGIALLNQTADYRAMMVAQTDALDVSRSDVVLDLGSGVGSFSTGIAPRGVVPKVVSVDLVRAALVRARLDSGQAERPVQYDLDALTSLPFVDNAFHACLCSLVLSYLSKQDAVLAEMARVTRPGGRIVVSALRPDADISRIFQRSLVEIARGEFDRLATETGREGLVVAAREFLSDAARLVDLEEAGIFQFSSMEMLGEQFERNGLRIISKSEVLGDPPQAIMIVATPHAGA